MKHITDEDLTLLYYGEHDDPGLAAAVAESEELSARYDALCAELKLADAYQPPSRGDDYGAEVWQRISSRLDTKDAASGSRLGHWLASLLQPRFSLAGALSIALIAVFAFMLGRNGGPLPGNDPAAPSGTVAELGVGINSARLLNHRVSAHLEQVNILLTQFVNTSADTGSGETGHVTDLLVANRLYRQAAIAQGNQKLAAFLADLEPLLIELAYQAQSGSAATRERMQKEIENGLLFRVRVMNQQLGKPETSV